MGLLTVKEWPGKLPIDVNVSIKETVAGKRIYINDEPRGWLMTTINSQWIFSIDGYKPANPGDIVTVQNKLMEYINSLLTMVS